MCDLLNAVFLHELLLSVNLLLGYLVKSKRILNPNMHADYSISLLPSFQTRSHHEGLLMTIRRVVPLMAKGCSRRLELPSYRGHDYASDSHSSPDCDPVLRLYKNNFFCL